MPLEQHGFDTRVPALRQDAPSPVWVALVFQVMLLLGICLLGVLALLPVLGSHL